MLKIQQLPEEKALLLSGPNKSVKVIDYTTMNSKNKSSETANTILHNILSKADVPHTITDSKQDWNYKGSSNGMLYISSFWDQYEKIDVVCLSSFDPDDDNYESYLIELFIVDGKPQDLIEVLQEAGTPFCQE